jgi:hypothetical protein
MAATIAQIHAKDPSPIAVVDGGSYVSDNSEIKAEFTKDASGANVVMYTSGGYTIKWTPREIKYVDVENQIEDILYDADQTSDLFVVRDFNARYDRHFPDVEEWFRVAPGHLKHYVSLRGDQRPPLDFLVSPLLAVAGTLEYDTELIAVCEGQKVSGQIHTSHGIDLIAPDGRVIFSLPPIVVWDQAGNTTGGQYIVSSIGEGRLDFSMAVDYAWLSQDNIIYPVIIDPTITTTTATTAMVYSNQRKLDRDGNNNLWFVQIVSNTAKFYISTNGGNTWTYSSTSDIANTHDISLFIDANGYAHVTYTNSSDHKIKYRRGMLNGTNNGWVWSAETDIGLTATFMSSYVTGADATGYRYSLVAPDVVAHPLNGGWVAHVVVGEWYYTTTGGFPYHFRLWWNTIMIDGNGNFTVGTPTKIFNDDSYSQVQPPSGATLIGYPNIMLKHNGDGKTLSGSTPTVFIRYTWGVPNGPCIKFFQGVYSGNSWSWSTLYTTSTPVLPSGSSNYQLSSFDGTRIVTAFLNGNPMVVEYDTSTSLFKDYSSSMPSISDGNVVGLSLTVTQYGDIYLFATFTTSKLTKVTKYTRSSGTWSSWTQLSSNVTPSNYCIVTAKRVDSNYQIEVVNMEGSASPYNLVYYMYANTDLAPNAPILNQVNAFDATLPQTLSWQFTDPNGSGDYQSAYQLQIYDTSNLSSPVLDTGKVGSPSTQYVLAANTLQNGKTYQWRVMVWDSGNMASPWSSYSTFRTSKTPTATVTSPAPNATVIYPSYTFTGQYSQPNGVVQQSYQFKLWDAAGQTVVQDTGTILGTANQKTFNNLANGASYQIEFIVTSQDGLTASSGKIPFSVSYTPAATPTSVTATNDPVNARVAVSWTNPTPTGNQPNVVSNNIYRKKVGDTTWRLVATGVMSSPYYDYTAPLGTFIYGVEAVGDTGATSSGYGTSGQVTSSFDRNWIIDESNPLNNVSFYYNMRQNDTEVNQTYTPVQTFAKYPRIRKSQARFRTGTLTAMYLQKDGDVISQVDKVDAICNSDKTYLLKTVDGRIYRVSLSEFKYTGRYGQQIADVSVKWTEVGDV